MLLSWALACGSPAETTAGRTDTVSVATAVSPVPDVPAPPAAAHAPLDLHEPTVIILHLDSLETEHLLAQAGGEELFEAADDLFYYEGLLCERLDALGVPVLVTDQDSVAVWAAGQAATLLKDTAVALSSYYYFDGQHVRSAELWELLERWEVQ